MILRPLVFTALLGALLFTSPAGALETPPGTCRSLQRDIELLVRSLPDLYEARRLQTSAPRPQSEVRAIEGALENYEIQLIRRLQLAQLLGCELRR